jgi:ERF superfamily
MLRSSETIGTVAGALAKAQAELTNPEKSLVATIRTEGPGRGGVERSFRYAPLSSGLDIVRKTLSHHEIATVQTTAVNQAGGIITLTTVLAHSSGEWIASDWPVCAISETANPHRMGAALTYARRYALFTLVGIAGEDDIDAPDLNAPTSTAASGLNQPAPTKNESLNGGQAQSAPQQIRGDRNADRGTRAGPRLSAPLLDPEASSALRDQLAADLKGIGSAEEAAAWAYRVLGAKSTLVAADAKYIEEAFQQRLAEFDRPGAISKRRKVRSRKSDRPRASTSIDKSELSHPEPRRLRDREHVRFVTKQPCLICGRTPSDPHHLRFAQHSALGRKVSDEFTVPLCRGHHREVHRCGDEAAWWDKAGVNPSAAARALWLKTRPLPTRLGLTA